MGGGSYTERMRIHTNGWQRWYRNNFSCCTACTSLNASLTTTGTGRRRLKSASPKLPQVNMVTLTMATAVVALNIGSLYTGGGAASFGTFTFRQHSSTTSQVPMLIDNVGTVLVNGAHNNGGNANFAVDGGAYLTFYDNQVQIGNSSPELEFKKYPTICQLLRICRLGTVI